VDAYLRDKFVRDKRKGPRNSCGESLQRYLNFCRFCLVCTASLFQVLVRYPHAPAARKWGSLGSCTRACMHAPDLSPMRPCAHGKLALSLRHRISRSSTLKPNLSPHAPCSQAPWVLSTMEFVPVLLIYFLCTIKPLIIHQNPQQYHFSFSHSLEDVIVLSITRAVILSGAYIWANGAQA
jgi:hypothetical protein